MPIDYYEAEQFCRSLAPELGEPFYVVLTSEGAPLELMAGNLGLSSVVLDLAFQPYLELAGRWQGRGPCVALDDQQHLLDAAWSDTLAERLIRASLIHELAHAVTQAADAPSFAADVETVDAAQAMMAAALALQDRPRDWEVPPWYLHDAAWLRRCCHFLARAQAAGFAIEPELVAAHDLYALSPLAEYADDLAGEVLAMLTASFSEIEASEPPPAFVHRWRGDVRSFFAEARPDERAARLVVQALQLYSDGPAAGADDSRGEGLTYKFNGRELVPISQLDGVILHGSQRR